MVQAVLTAVMTMTDGAGCTDSCDQTAQTDGAGCTDSCDETETDGAGCTDSCVIRLTAVRDRWCRLY